MAIELELLVDSKKFQEGREIMRDIDEFVKTTKSRWSDDPAGFHEKEDEIKTRLIACISKSILSTKEARSASTKLDKFNESKIKGEYEHWYA